jgi:transposase-like protein
METNCMIEAIEKFQNRKNDPKNYKTYDIEESALIQTYINGRHCPHCKSRNVVSNGNYKGRKKYKCKECGKNFNNLTKTPFSGIHNLDKMGKYIGCMIEGKTIRDSAKDVSIATSTSFNWRHRLLGIIENLPGVKMKEVVEMEEVKVKFSTKGRKKQITAEEKKLKVSVIFASDRTGKIDSNKNVETDESENKILQRFMSESEPEHLLFCPDKKVFRTLIRTNPNVRTIKTSSDKNKNVKATIPEWTNWMQRFHGVATKYLSNYLHWFDYITNCDRKDNKINSMINFLFHKLIVNTV